MNRKFETTSPSDEVEWGNQNYIASYAFQNMKMVANSLFVIPAQITTINSDAFSNIQVNGASSNQSCTLTIPSTVTNIGTTNCIRSSMAFGTINYFCTVSRPYYSHFNSYNYAQYINMANISEIDADSFSSCPYLVEIKVLDTLTKIFGNAIKNCQRLERIYLPSTLTEIRSNVATSGCPLLSEVHIAATTPPTLASGCFTSNPTIYVPSAAVSTYQANASWGQFTIVAES